jgi:hypothetical protein
MGKKEQKRLIAVALCLNFVMLCVLLIYHPEPRYNGRPLSEWLMIYDQRSETKDPQYEEARQAVQAVRKDALPCLVRWLRTSAPESEVGFWFNKMIGRWPLFPEPPQYYKTAWSAYESRQRNWAVVHGFEILGTNGAPAAAKLARTALSTADSTTDERCGSALHALTSIGPPAMPSLLSVATNRNTSAWKDAFRWICIGCTNEGPILPALVNCLTNRDSDLAAWAALALGRGGFEINATLSACTNLIKNTDPEIRQLAIAAIGFYGTRARACADEVKAALSDPDKKVSGAAASALPKIAPNVSVPGPAP